MQKRRHLPLRHGRAALQPVAQAQDGELALAQRRFQKAHEFFVYEAGFDRLEDPLLLLEQEVHQRQFVALLVDADGVGQIGVAAVLLVAADEHEDLVFDAAGGVGGQLRALPLPIGVDRLDQPDAADRDEVVCLRRPVVLFDDVRDQAHIVAHEHIFGGGVARAGEAQVLCLLFGRKGLGKGSFAADRARKKQDLCPDRLQKIQKHKAPPSDTLLYERQNLYYTRFRRRAGRGSFSERRGRHFGKLLAFWRAICYTEIATQTK